MSSNVVCVEAKIGHNLGIEFSTDANAKLTFISLKIIICLFERQIDQMEYREYKQEEIFIFWFITQVAAIAEAGED